MRTPPVKALAGVDVAAALAPTEVTAVTEAAEAAPARSLTAIAAHDVTVAPDLHPIDATIAAVDGGSVHAYATDGEGVRVEDFGVVASAAVAGTVSFTVPRAGFVGAGAGNQLFVEVVDAAGVALDGQGARIARFLGAPVTLATAPGLAMPTLTEGDHGTVNTTSPVTKGQPGTPVTVSMWSGEKGEFAEYLKASTAAPAALSFSVPTADFGGPYGACLMVTVYTSVGDVIDSNAYTSSMLEF